MAKIFQLSKRIYINNTQNTKTNDCEFYSYDKYFAENLLKTASIKLNNKDDFGALKDINKAIKIYSLNNKAIFDTGLLGLFHLNAKNYDLACNFIYKCIANASIFPTPLALCLSVVFEIQKKYKASIYLRNLILNYETNSSLAQLAHLTNNFRHDILKNSDNGCNIQDFKLLLNAHIKNRDVKNAFSTLKALWEIDNSDIFINYWYNNFDEKQIELIDHIPFKYIVNKNEEIEQALVDDEKMKILCVSQDADCLFNIVVRYSTIKVAKNFCEKAINLNLVRIMYHIENFIFSQENDLKKLEIFLTLIKNNYHNNKRFKFRYKDYLVNVNYFDYKQLCNINKKIADAFLLVIKQLIIDGNYNIDFSNQFINNILKNDIKIKDANLNTIRDYIIYNYYKTNNMTLPNYLNKDVINLD